MIDVPGLNPGSEAILKRLNGLDMYDKLAFLENLVSTPEGKRAFAEAEAEAEAEAITDAIKLRFAYQARSAEMFRQQELVRSERKGLGLGLRM